MQPRENWLLPCILMLYTALPQQILSHHHLCILSPTVEILTHCTSDQESVQGTPGTPVSGNTENSAVCKNWKNSKVSDWTNVFAYSSYIIQLNYYEGGFCWNLSAPCHEIVLESLLTFLLTTFSEKFKLMFSAMFLCAVLPTTCYAAISCFHNAKRYFPFCALFLLLKTQINTELVWLFVNLLLVEKPSLVKYGSSQRLRVSPLLSGNQSWEAHCRY